MDTALALDAAANGDPGMRRAATFAMLVGLAGAVGAAVTGLTDWSETEGEPMPTLLVDGEPGPDWPELQAWLASTATRLAAPVFESSAAERT